MFPCRIGTYFNATTGHESVIDYLVRNDKCTVKNGDAEFAGVENAGLENAAP